MQIEIELGKKSLEALNALTEAVRALSTPAPLKTFNPETTEAQIELPLETEKKESKKGKAKKAEETVEETPAEETVEETPTEDETVEIDFKQIVQAFQQLRKEKGTNTARDVLAKLKVKTVQEIEKKNYAKTLEMISGVLND